jgi:hypothetical protein
MVRMLSGGLWAAIFLSASSKRSSDSSHSSDLADSVNFRDCSCADTSASFAPMTILRPGGIDVIYMDESARYPNFFATVVRIPFLRQKDNLWRFVWQDSYDLADQWRRSLSKAHQIRFRQELHAHEILGRKGLYQGS